MKVCANCVYWSHEMKGLCRLTRVGVGQFASCRRWQEHSPAKEEKGSSAWKGLPN